MKLHANKFAIAVASIVAVFFGAKRLVAKLFFSKIFSKVEYFVPEKVSSKLPGLGVGHVIIKILIVFAVAFALTWLLATVYNKYATRK